MDKSRHDNRPDQWRKRTSARRSRARRACRDGLSSSMPRPALWLRKRSWQQSDRLPDISVSKLLGPKPQPLIGVASVIDGDTIEIHGQRIRFNGIDAPESKQYCDDAKGFEYPCGRLSAEALDSFLAASRPVQCTLVTWDRYSRFVADCRHAEGASVAAWLVEHGQAPDWQRCSQGAYAQQQAKAKAAKVGLWVGKFETPWDWRASHPDGSEPARQPRGIMSRKLVAQSGGLSCEPRRYCAQISSRDDAQWYLHNWSWGRKLDRDGDGVACETLC
ncbi:thermonuclease family protein [Mesorhizobium sp. M2A.F.Ca.ET.043.02.1.1]|uniref:thermonuclease family protein n=1 Tax=Mesorhizobium sp. M2A.F.Ca.ET.043.02.1.1 TaxID=2493670 RepID=UPI001FDF8F62|nr:thermonuclease family protein [Mesorhizobium sp. M2A.F.Ca.ET.043.02.1.1]